MVKRQFSKEEIREKYQNLAEKYDILESPLEFLFIARLRRRLISNAKGKVLEVGVGTGKNLKYYSKGCQITAVDYTPKMLERAKRRALKLDINVKFKQMDAQKLAFESGRFDTIVDSLCLCTYPNPIKALKEMRRVCKKNGRILLLEHGISDKRLIRKLQHLREKGHYDMFGCNLMRDPLELAKEAGLKILKDERKIFGIFYIIEAMP